MSQTCEAMRSKALSDAKTKETAANSCTAKFGLCRETCSGYASTYSESDSSSSFTTAAYACARLSSKAQEILSASSTSLDASDSGLACEEKTEQSPQSLADSAGQSPAAAAAENASVACAANPNSAECAQAQAQYAAARAAVAGFNEVETGRGSFDTADLSGQNAGSQFGGVGEAGANGNGIKNGTIANNTGGGIPGGGGGANAKGAGGPTTALGGFVSSIVDIEKGLYGGGYAEALNGEDPNAVPTDVQINRALAALGVGPLKPDIDPDLKRYLPGGDLYRRPYNPADLVQFHSPGVDIWSRIHDRYREKCLLGQLYGCE